MRSMGCYCYYRYRDYDLEGTGAGFACCLSDKSALLYEKFHKSYCSCFIKSTQADLENELWLLGVGGKVGGKIVKETGMDVYTLLYLKRMTNKDLLHTHGTLLSIMWQPGEEGSLGQNGYTYMYG